MPFKIVHDLSCHPIVIVILVALTISDVVESLQGRGISGLYELVDGNRNDFRAVSKELTDWIAVYVTAAGSRL